MHELQKRAGEAPFAREIADILREPVDPAVIDIKPDGALYVPQKFYRDRLDDAFGIGGWALIPLEKPMTKGTRVYYFGYLVAHGRFISDAVGGGEYIANNPMDTWDNCVEKAKSDCLTRCCKALPMFRECWDKEFCEAWKATWAEEVDMPRTKRGRGWKKKGAMLRNFDVRPGRASQSEYDKPPRVEDENQAHIDSIKGNRRLLVESKTDWNENNLPGDGWEDQ